MFKAIYNLFDKLEDKVRGKFSHYPILYAIVGGVGCVLYWRGVWHTTDYLMELIHARRLGLSSIDLNLGPWWDGPLSLVVGLCLLLLVGLFVSSFIGNEIIISGLRGEHKLTAQTEKEVKQEVGSIAEVLEQLKRISGRLDSLEQKIGQSDKSKTVSSIREAVKEKI